MKMFKFNKLSCYCVIKISLIMGLASVMTIWGMLLVKQIEQINQEELIYYKSLSSKTSSKIYSQFGIDKQYYSRAKILISANALLREVIWVLGLIGSLKDSNYLTQTSGMSMAIVWLATHLNVGDELWFTSKLFLVGNILKLIVTVLTLVYGYFLNGKTKLKINNMINRRDEVTHL